MEPTFNLTEAVANEECIDFGQLEYRLARAINKELGTHIQFKMIRDFAFRRNTPEGWNIPDGAYGELLSFHIFRKAWNGEDGWHLEVAGEKPIKEADLKDLEVGTWFKDSDGDIGVIICGVRASDEKMAYWPNADQAWMHRANDFRMLTAVETYDEMPKELLKSE